MAWTIRTKKIEKDAQLQLGEKYVNIAKKDSKMCDLMLSNSRFFTHLIKNSFWYNGEILEQCSPRNDIFYNEKMKSECYFNVRKSLGLSNNCKIVLYAPTFRTNSSDLSYYHINWDKVIPSLERSLGGKVEILIRLHPNISSNMKDVSMLINYSHVHNVTNAPDITDYLLAADAMISDYTSAMFDFALLRKPCFIYATDKDEYDRGFYWQLSELPFSLSETEDKLIENIESFSLVEYNKKQEDFIRFKWGLDEDGKACERLYTWMINV